MKTLLLKLEKSILLVFLLIASTISKAQNTQPYSANGNFITPAGVTSIKFEAYGAGGGGGRGGTTNKYGGGGGGGGAYSVNNSVTVSPGTSYSITVGTGGLGGSATSTDGKPGSLTSATFGSTTITANGGTGGRSYTNGRTGGTGGSGTYKGGNGGTGSTSGSGGGGGGAGTTGVGGNGNVTSGGADGGGLAGDGGNGKNSNSTPGDDGNTYGGGGGGGTRNQDGGDGANGYAIITYTCPTYALTSVASSDICGSVATITLNATPTDLPVGNYVVSYATTGATSGNSIASMTVTTAGTGSFTIPAITVGETTITITYLASSFCQNIISTNNSVVINAFNAPVVNAGSAITTCATSGSVDVTTGCSAANQTSIIWTTSGSGTFVDANSLTNCTYTPSPADISAGSVTLTLTAYGNSPCANATSTKTLTISRTITATAGTSITICSSLASTNITAGASATNHTAATWTSSGTGTFANPTSLTTCSYTPSAADKAAGGVTLFLTVTNEGCDPVITTKALTIVAAATAVAGTAIATCTTSGAVNITAGSSAANQTNVAWTSNGTGSFTDANSLTTCTYNPSAADILAGSVTLRLTAYGNSPCGNVTSTKTLTIKSPMTALAGTNLTTCSSSGAINITSGAIAANHTSATWTSSGTGTFTNANSLTTCTYNPSAADKAAGSVTLTLTATNGGCADAVSTKTLNITAAPIAVAGPAMATCSNSGAINITAGSSASNQASITWTSSGSGSFTNANSLTACTYNPSASDISAGSVTLTLTAYGSSPCGNTTSTKTLTISRAMTAVAGNAITICSSTSSINVTSGSSASNYTSLAWTSSGTGTFTSPGSLTSCVYTPSAADISAGGVTLTLTAANIGCGNLTSTKTLTINSLPTAVAGPAMTACTAAGAVNITSGSSASNQTSVTWTSSGTGTFANANSLTDCTYTPSAADRTAGSVTLTLRAYGAAPCANVTSTKVLTIAVSPTVTGTTPGSRTGVGTVNLAATASAGVLNWYTTLTGGSPIGTGTNFTTPVISATTIFYVEAFNGVCASIPRTPVTATVNYPEIDIQGNATSIVSGDTTPSATDWTDFGTTTATRTFTIRNIGSALLTVGAVTISGANASDFSITTLPSATVAIGASTTFVVTFTPTTIGAKTANISIVNNDTDENPYTFDIQGTGIQQEIDVQGNAVSIVDGDTTPSTADWTDFSSVAGTRTYTIRNLGNIVLTVGTVTIGGTHAADFTVTTQPATSVPAFGSTTFVVTFSPSTINTRTATVNIPNNDSNENPYDYAIQGFGIMPEIDIQGNNVSIADNDTTPSTSDWTDFSTNGSRTFTIYNTGNITLTLGTPSITGTNASEFTFSSLPPASIPAFSSATFTIAFQPTALGVRSAVFTIANNDSNENPYNFNIQGTGVAREIDIQGLGLSIANNDLVTSINDGTDFGPADINLATVTRTFTIRNTGSLALTISNPTITGTHAADFSITANPGTLLLGANASTTFQVTFNPSAVFTRSARINIVNNDSDENPYIFAIQGTGLLDNDGDGIENNADQDDDNDGILDIIECGTCISEPFVNGSFESPVIGNATYAILPTSSVPGWQTSAENYIEIWSTGMNGGYGAVPAAAGNQFAELNANVAGILYQPFCLNGAGGTIHWAIKHRGRAGSDTAYVRFGSNLANAISSTPIVTMVDGNTAWGSYSGTYNIPVGQTTIVLAFQAGPTASGDASIGNLIDDVQIIINQNCVDTDGDGVPDILDLDSDNDGIPDIEEAGFKQYSNNTGTMDKTNPANWKDLNGNGINDYIDARIAAGTYVIPDTDGDGVYNHLDLDSDNDTLWDVDEAGLLNGDGDINGDGKGDGLDSEGDGLLNIFDNSTAFGSAFRPYAQDSDSNGIADYLQLDSNDDGINDIDTGLYGSYDTNGDGKIDGTGDADGDGIPDIFDTDDIVRGSPRDLNRKLYLDFDGRNDYAENVALLGGLPEASLMAWIDLNSAFNSAGVVVGQDKFQIRITGNKRLEAAVNNTILTYNPALTTSQWYHVAATYGGGSLKLYLNGVLVATQAATGNIAADASKLTLGKDPVSNIRYFKGKMDEVRVFNVALTDAQVQRMVYQEVQNTSSQVRGAIVPKDIGALPFANMLRCYRMDAYKDDIVDDITTPAIDTGTGMKMYNHKIINVQQAPMPFTTVRAGSFATAINDPSKDIRGLDATELDYSIIQVKHNITETANNVDLAMFVDPGVTISMGNDTKIQNDWYLKLDGKIDLVGKSQLIQTTNSDLDVTSAGSIERDQQGQSNAYNYNYWSSPVSTINTTSINHGYTVAGVMKDGTDVDNIQNINWSGGLDGSPTSPITLASYWIFKFQNYSNSYANWSAVGPNGTLLAGQGYTLKGSNAATSNQNYTFAGKPNNGTITSTVSPNNLNLCGNPYASAIDADQFIDDNAASITGTLSFWEHYATNNSHVTIQYQGGYATYTKVGGTAPVAPAGVSGLGASSKVAKRFIPVGQGFFVTGSAAGGTITFKNSQRLFVKENNAASFSLYRNGNPSVNSGAAFNNSEDTFAVNQFMKLRLGYTSADNYFRGILLGFMNENATAGFDNGYDAISIEDLTNDMYFMNGESKLNIQGDGFFNAANIYPLGVKNQTEGTVKFTVYGKENFEDSQDIFIYDNETQIYHDVKSQDFEINLPAGTFESRFSLRFRNGEALGNPDNEAQFGVGITHSQTDNMVNINNQLQEVSIKSVALYNLLGQQVISWDISNPYEAEMHLPVTNVSSGGYIVKVVTDKGNISKKILIK